MKAGATQSDELLCAADDELGYVPAAHALAGKDHGDNVRHVIVRAAFVAELTAYSRVEEEFEEWGRETRLFAAADSYLAALWSLVGKLHVGEPGSSAEEVAEGQVELLLAVTHELDYAQHLLMGARDESRAIEAVADLGAIERAASAAAAARDELAGLLSSELPTLVPRAEALVRNLLKPGWPWVAFDLVETFAAVVYARTCPGQVVRTAWAEEEVAPAPSVRIPAIRVRPGTPADVALQQLDEAEEEIRRARAALRAVPKSRGRLPGPSGAASLERDARWFFANRVEGRSVRELAKQRHLADCGPAADHPWENDRTIVTIGIALAEKLLGAVQYHWKDPGKISAPRP